MALPFPFDFKNPDYVSVFRHRAETLNRLRAAPDNWAAMRAYYAEHPIDWIEDWGMVNEPRNADLKQITDLPFILFQKQKDFITWMMARRARRERGLADKSREMGASWVCVALACHSCLFFNGAIVGFGSRKEEYVDGDMKSLFAKARYYMDRLPRELRGGWERKKHAPYMKLTIPDTGSMITGEAGDNIGRGNRTSWYLVDEAAHLEHPEAVDASLSATTNCRIDVSSVKGMANPFAQLRWSGKVPVFTLHWRDDPRKDQAWYDKKCLEETPVTIAQEYDINYAASVEGVVIPYEWVKAAVDSHIMLGLTVTGERRGAFDVADEGSDKNSFGIARGILLEHIEEWSGIGSDIFSSVDKVHDACRNNLCDNYTFDADGLGAGVRGDARIINERDQVLAHPIIATPFRGSGEVLQPERQIMTAASVERVSGSKEDRKNKDYYANRKAQAWFLLRLRFQLTFRARQGQPIADPDLLVSLDSKLPNLQQVMMELSQPTYIKNGAGKMLIDKKPDGTKSPNLGDTVMMLFGASVGARSTVNVSDDLISALEAQSNGNTRR